MKNKICGLNYLDVAIRKGFFPLSKLGASTFPITMGVEAAGTVEKLGAKVEGLTVGERVAFVFIGSGTLINLYLADLSDLPSLSTLSDLFLPNY